MARYRSGRKHEPIKHPGEPRPPSAEEHPAEPEVEGFSDGFEGASGMEMPRFEAPRGEGSRLREVEDSPELRKLQEPNGGSNGD